MIKEKILSNKTILVYEKLSHLRSVCTGIWYNAGSRYETKKSSGVSHFTEHMIFKGTQKRSARDIADEFDGIGGILNGFTGKEATCYYAMTLDIRFTKAAEILADMVQNSLFDGKMIERERKVILEEMAMYADSPEDYVHEKLEKEIWVGNSLSFPVIGTRETIKNIDRNMMQEYAKRYMSPANTVISVAGNFDESEMIYTMERLFGSTGVYEDMKEVLVEPPGFVPGRKTYNKEIEQTYVSIAFKTMGYENESRYAMMIMAAALGGSMSSRLFQNLREEKGLVYSIGAVNQIYSGTGILNIYAGTAEKKLEEAILCIKEEVDDIYANGITEEELNRAKEQLKGNFILGMESTNARMSFMGKNRLLKGYVEEQDNVIAKIDVLTIAEIKKTAGEILDWNKVALSVLTAPNSMKSGSV